MTLRKNLTLVMIIFATAWVVGACGKDEGGTESKSTGSADQKSTVAELAKQSMPGLTIDDDFLEGRRFIEDAGYVVKSYDEFPAGEIGVKGRILVYTDKRKKQSGVIYLKKIGGVVQPVWHWHFQNMVPDSVVKKEINGDGLWDIRVMFPRGKTEDFIQDQSFTLLAPGRSDWIAMNGKSSPPLSEEFAMWKCFDGDTASAWKSALSNKPFIELDVPFGVKDGVLEICTLSTEQPDRCVVYADGKRVEEVELKPVAGRQEIALGAGVRGAKKVRLEFPSVRGGGSAVAVAELGLR